jgi:hypothetical protein
MRPALGGNLALDLALDPGALIVCRGMT